MALSLILIKGGHFTQKYRESQFDPDYSITHNCKCMVIYDIFYQKVKRGNKILSS